MNLDQLAKRIDALLAIAQGGVDASNATIAELVAGTVSVLGALYGPDSPQMRTFQSNTTRDTMSLAGGYFATARAVARGTLSSTKAELESGLIGSLRGQIAGEVVADFVGMANEVLKDKSDGATSVAAVLTAAAYEDCLRRLADLKGLPHQEKLADVVTALKANGSLVGSQVTFAVAGLKFRNNAMHAQWSEIDRASVVGFLGFVKELLAKHFT